MTSACPTCCGPVFDVMGWEAIAEELQVDERTARRYADWPCEHRLRIKKMGGHVVTTKAALRAWINGLPDGYCEGCGSVRWR